ncbi:dimethylamine monooxygenase subunit DmmA family protein [Nocardioides sp. GY 10127]|uniref:dimethylamine monooxygenase subunit DmmA family protein n=1 Tax=Nocardioides sp. GY 10127 TaxID=2569762 RepID=UPI0010A88711|nr:dimethylamine monooxygenase subunit DmmA family protein [Nocardioides sp. GY 10127]TIC79917.1 hypothetical protein E8D37_14810 [Nocardioides sp. GY 10127]
MTMVDAAPATPAPDGRLGEQPGEKPVEQPLGLPVWPAEPEPVDPRATGYLVAVCGADPRAEAVGAYWSAAATRVAPTRLLALPDGPVGAGRDLLVRALGELRTGARVMVAGGRHDVLVALAVCRAQGACPEELRSFAVDAHDGPVPLPVFCAHCRAVHAMTAEPGGTTTCPGCARELDVHPHHSAALGAFLASDARARELA